MLSHYSITVVTTHGKGWVASYPTLEEATAYASAVMISSGNAVEVLISAMTGNTGTLVKRYRRDNT
jgi:hypothetical protein